MTRPTPPSASWQAPARLPQPWRAGERLRDPRALPPKKTERFLGLTCGKQRHQVFMAKLDDASATRSLPLTTIAPAQSASLHRADKRSDFGLYSHQSRPLAEYSRSLGTLLVPPPLSRSASFRGLVTLRQTFAHRSQSITQGPGTNCRKYQGIYRSGWAESTCRTIPFGQCISGCASIVSSP